MKTKRFKAGQAVRITTAARVDMIGRVAQVTPNGKYLVRVPGWMADGYPLETMAHADELERSTVALMWRAAEKRGWTRRDCAAMCYTRVGF